MAVEMARLEGIDATFEGDPAVRDLVRGTGAKALMYAACGKEVVEEDTMSGMQAVAWTLADNMELFGYDGILLDVPGLTSAGKEKLVKLAEEIKGRMTKGKLLYVMVDAPAWNDEAPGGYDYEALGKTADRMTSGWPPMSRRRRPSPSRLWSRWRNCTTPCRASGQGARMEDHRAADHHRLRLEGRGRPNPPGRQPDRRPRSRNCLNMATDTMPAATPVPMPSPALAPARPPSGTTMKTPYRPGFSWPASSASPP